MCFSASASFGTGALLTVIGIATIRKTTHRSQLAFAAIPFIFGLQQLAEGVLWLTLHDPDYAVLQNIATYTFLFFAQVIWPLWVPVAIMRLSRNPQRINQQRTLAGIGFLVGAFLLYCLCAFPVKAEIAAYHIRYIQEYPAIPLRYGIIPYVLATIVPPFFSNVRRMWLLGASVAVSYLLAALFYNNYLLSVWCFFASIISISIYVIIAGIAKRKASVSPPPPSDPFSVR